MLASLHFETHLAAFWRQPACDLIWCRVDRILNYISSAQAALHYTLELVLGFLIPYSIIVVSYIRILRRLQNTKFGRRIRSEKLILAIVLTFCLFWLPYHIINMVQVCHTFCFYSNTFFQVWM